MEIKYKGKTLTQKNTLSTTFFARKDTYTGVKQSIIHRKIKSSAVGDVFLGRRGRGGGGEAVRDHVRREAGSCVCDVLG